MPASRIPEVLKRKPGKRGYAALAALLALALAVPLGMHFTAPDPKPADPRAAHDKAAQRPLSATEAAREAKRTGKDVEVTAERTANSTTWAQPDGLMRMRTHSDTIRAKVDGEWKKIDTTLQRVKGGYAPRAVNNALLFSAGSSAEATGGEDRASRTNLRTTLRTAASTNDDGRSWSELVRLTVDGHDLVVSWPGPLPAPVVDGPRALYEDIRPGIDLLLTARDGGYSHVLIVHTSGAAKDPLLADLDYRLSSPTATFTLSAGSNVAIARDHTGQEIAAAPTPYMWDSAGTVKATIGEPAPTLEPTANRSALDLPGLTGPQPGTHEAVLGAALDSGNVLDLAVDAKLLTDADTVYPVFIDPSLTGRKQNWTLLYAQAPTSSFYNGQNFNDGTNEARVGYEATTGGLSRSVFNFEQPSKLRGATIHSSYFKAWQTYSWGCSARQYNVHLTSLATSTSTWNNQPTWGRLLASPVNGHGYRADTCPDAWAATDVKSVTQEAATKGWTAVGIGLRAANESDTNAWKKFLANGDLSPHIITTYNRTPNEPTQQAMTSVPGGVCDITSPPITIGKSDITFNVTGTDPDGNLRYVHLKVWPTGYPSTPVWDEDMEPASNGAISKRIPWGSFTAGKSYSWSAWTKDTEGGVSGYGPAGTSVFCQFTVDHTAPSSPTVTSAHFPPPGKDLNQWSTVPFGTAGDFTLSTTDTSVVKYEYAFNGGTYSTNPALVTTGGSPVTKTLKPPMTGVNFLYAWAVDAAGNRSATPAKYVFYVTPRKVPDPPGDISGDGTPDLLAIDTEGKLRHYPAETAGDVHIHMPGAYETAGTLEGGHWTHPTSQAPALISHSGDWYPGDGVNDLLARMPDGKLYLYPGDGYGTFNVDDRLDVLLPAGAPDPATLTQLAVTSDITGDGLPDMFARAGTQLWAFSGYTGGSFKEAKLLSSTGWDARDIVTVADITGDGIADLLARTEETGRGLVLRHGKAAGGGGVDLNSLATAAASGTGREEVYGTNGWNRAAVPMIKGTPDATGDGIPDIWAASATDGYLRFYPGGRTAHGAPTVVGTGNWHMLLTLG
ncbi:FG-GAP-like repeat-containing protein [Streptomyces sp. NPDC002992]|uniref:FG-GAP-like repeat-containing protein n=1 Tax=Streptomyces sp. NPDC002992 TaxID=3154273 RepID=UPI0033BC25EF